MAKFQLVKATTSRRVGIFIQDSSSTTGAGLTGLLFNSSGLTWYYWIPSAGNVDATQVTLATMTRGTWATGGFIEKDATNMPGVYEIGIPDAALAAGEDWVLMMLKGATNMADLLLEIQLTDVNLNSATNGGMSDIAAILVDTGTTLDAALAVVDANVDQIETAVITNAVGADVSADIATLQTDSTAIVADTNELQVDWLDGGRLDLLIDAILLDTGTTIPGTITTLQTDSTLIVADTGELQTDWVDGGRLDLIIDAILVDTGTTLDAALAVVDGNVDSILVDTGTTLDAALAVVDGNVDTILVDTASLNDTKIPDTISLAAINAEVDTALRTTTDGEPAQGTPGATISIEEKISWLYKAWRNRTTSTATQYNLYNDDATTIDTLATLADDGTTASRTEMTTGP